MYSPRRRPTLFVGYCLGAFLFAGCSSKSPEPPAAADSSTRVESVTAKPAAPKRVTDRPGNKLGRVFIAMYHHIRKGKGDMFRTVDEFRSDLEMYFKMGFRPVLASEYIEDKMPLPPGASPIVLTFDDSNPSQIQLRKDGSVDPESAVGIWMDFAKDHPDFPVHGTFFALPDSMWGQDHQVKKKLEILEGLGSEIGNHTINHRFLNRLSDTKVKWELGRATERLSALGIKPPHVMAVPYGVMPRNLSLLKGFEFRGKHVEFEGVFRADGPPARSPEDPEFDKLKIPRMVAASCEDSIKTFLDEIEEGKYQPYVQP